MLNELRCDLSRYHASEGKLSAILGNAAFWALIWYRFGHWIYRENCPRFVRLPLKVIHSVFYKFLEVFMQMRLDPNAQIGPGLYMTHVGSIHLHPDVVIGRNCSLAHQVTIGTSALGREGVPRIGDNVYIGTGATVIGKIRIGDGARIAANTLVVHNVPAGATVMGVPGRVVMSPSLSVEKSSRVLSTFTEKEQI
jgi:serine O-acetyltransferase